MRLFGARPSDKRYKAFISYSHAVDRQLAPSLKSALQQFARPWYALRAMRVFHDTTNLSVSPDLWGSIEAVLGEAGFLLLLASPEAAASKWVRKELETFTVRGRADSVVLVLTDGVLAWDDATSDFDWQKTTAMPRLERPVFLREPLFIDMRWARQPAQLDLGNPRFRTDVASISAALLGIDLDEMVERDIIERRRSLRLARGAIVSLATLLVGVLALSALLLDQRDVAQAEANVARGRQLAAEANLILAQDHARIDTAVRLASEGLKLHHGVETDRALRDALALLPSHLSIGRHEGSVDQIQVLSDGMTFLTRSGNNSSLSEDNRIKLWNLDSGVERRAAIDTVDTLMALASSKDGRRLVGGGFGQVLRVWDGTSGEVIAVSKPQDAQIGSIALARDGQIAITAGHDVYAQLWRTNDAAPLGRLVHNDRIATVIANAAGDAVLTASDDGTARLWTPEGRERLRFRSKGATLRAIFLEPAPVIATSSTGGAVRLWDSRSGRLMRELMHGREVDVLEGSPNGRLLATAEVNGPVRLWEIASGRELHRLATVGNVNALAFDPDGSLLATGSFGVAQVWEAATGNEQARIPVSGWVNTLAMTGRPVRVLVGSSDGAVSAWATEGHAAVARRLSDGAVLALKVAPAGEPIAIVSAGRALPGGRMDLTSDFSHTTLWRPPDQAKYLDHGGKVLSVAFMPDGSRLAAAVGSTVQVVDVASGTERYHVHHDKTVLAVSWSGDGRFIASGSWDNRVRVWGASSGELLFDLPHAREVGSVALDYEGRVLATASGATAQVFDLSERPPAKSRLEFLMPADVASLAMNEPGTRIAIGDRAGNISVHDLDTGQRRWRMRHEVDVLALRFFEFEGRPYLVSGSGDQTARVWDADSGREIVRLQHAGRVWAVDITPGGRHIVTGADDRTTRIFAWRPADLLAEAARRLQGSASEPPAAQPDLPVPQAPWLDRFMNWLANARRQ